LLAKLFVQGTSQESHVLFKLELLREILPGFDFTEFDLPWYDELGYDDVRKWVTWQEGRDAVGRMCRYIAELEAFSAWLGATRSIGKNHPSRDPPCETDFERFMGTWATTISSKSQWMELYRSFVPIYIISELPASSPLITNDLIFWELDGGERYRDNQFDSLHHLPNRTITLPIIPPGPWPSFVTFPRQNPTPSEITLPPFPQGHDPLPPVLSVVRKDPSSCFSHNKPWTSYLFTHQLAKDRVRLQDTGGSRNRRTLTFKEQCLGLFYYVPPSDDVLRADQDPHPFFWVCAEGVEPTDTHYEEWFDEDHKCWWFRLVRDKRLR
jgi:hypothetical protein